MDSKGDGTNHGPTPPEEVIPPFEPDFDLIGQHERAPKPGVREAHLGEEESK
jgi:hypothetical protein